MSNGTLITATDCGRLKRSTASGAIGLQQYLMLQSALVNIQSATLGCSIQMEINTHEGRISLKKSHKIILLIIGFLIMLVVIAFALKSAYRLGQQNAPREEKKQTNQSAG
jgi:hypothetical protein